MFRITQYIITPQTHCLYVFLTLSNFALFLQLFDSAHIKQADGAEPEKGGAWRVDALKPLTTTVVLLYKE